MSTADEGGHPLEPGQLDRILDGVSAGVGPAQAEAARAFAVAFVRRMSPDDLADRADGDLAALILGLYKLADGRGRDDVAVRVFNPGAGDDGYRTAGSVLETNVPDSPFLFDSVSEELDARHLPIRRVIHPVIGVERSPEGRIDRILHVREAASRESVMHFEIDRRLESAEATELEEAIRRVLGDVRLVVRDFGAMKDAARRMIETARAGSPLYGEDEISETVAFLEWLLDLNFVFLGYREYELVDLPEGRAMTTVDGSGLGILSKPGWSAYKEPVLLSSIEENLRARIEGGDLLIYSKTNRPSTVHRRARMDYIGVRRVAPDGRIVGESRMVGLFTSKAYMDPASHTPLLHRKLKQLLEAEDLFEGSHDYKAVVSIFESFPKDELFAASAEELRAPGDGAAPPPGAAARPAVRASRPVRTQRVDAGRHPARPVQRRGAPAAAGAVPPALQGFLDRLSPLDR